MGPPIAAARQYFPAPSFPTFIEVSPLIAARTESLGRGITRRVVEFAFPGTVQKALPLVPVEHEHPAFWIIGDAHQNPVAVTRLCRPMPIGTPGSPKHTMAFGNNGVHTGKSNLNGTGAVSRTLPFLSVGIDTEFLDRGLGDHGRLATPQ